MGVSAFAAKNRSPALLGRLLTSNNKNWVFMESESAAACLVLEQLLLRTCALQCPRDNSGSKKDCVRGCSLTISRPLRAAALALNILGLEDQDSHESILNDIDRKTAENRMLSIYGGMLRGCKKECSTYCAKSSKHSENCENDCNRGCENFVNMITFSPEKQNTDETKDA